MPSREEMNKQLLERMITEKVQMQYAKENGTRVDDQQLDKAIARIADTNGMSLQTFRDALEKDGISYGAFREDIRAEMVTQRLREREVENKIAVSEAEIDQFAAALGEMLGGCDSCGFRIADLSDVSVQIAQ